MAGKATPKESQTIGKIETRLGPVGKGHHNSHRTAALLKWLRDQESKKPSDSEANDTPKHERTETSAEKKKEGD